jgi:hypothetical protein
MADKRQKKLKKKRPEGRKATGRKLIISDFDDTLFFTEHSIAFASHELFGVVMTRKEVRNLDKPIISKIYDLAFSKYKDNLEPNTKLMDKYARMMTEGYEFMILSARGEQLREEVKYGLRLYDIKCEKIVLSNNDRRVSDEEWKSNFIKDYISDYDEILFFDDKIENLNMVREKVTDSRIRHFLVDRKGEKELKD